MGLAKKLLSLLSALLETQIHDCKSGFNAFYLLVVVYFPEKVGRKGRRGRQKLKLEEESEGKEGELEKKGGRKEEEGERRRKEEGRRKKGERRKERERETEGGRKKEGKGEEKEVKEEKTR